MENNKDTPEWAEEAGGLNPEVFKKIKAGLDPVDLTGQILVYGTSEKPSMWLKKDEWKNHIEALGQPTYYTDAKGKVVLVYNSIDEAPIHPDTPLLNIGGISDGYHTFDELYEFRKMYNAVLFNEWAKDYMLQYNTYKGIDKNKLHYEIKLMLKNLKAKYDVHKSWKHYDGEDCFGGGWFIVSAMLPTGLISNHYKAEDWDLFQVPEVEKALFEFDGHTGTDVLERLKALTNG